MKLKYFIFIIILLLSVYFIYSNNVKKDINILSINSLNKKDDYNPYLSNYLNNSNLNYKINVDLSNEQLEIENLIAKIEKNENEIQIKIHDSDIIILSLGNIDIKTESYTDIYKDLKELFKKIRNINYKEIIYISPSNLKSTTLIKELCHKYNIVFINGSSFKDKNNLLAQMIYRKIENQYNTKKY